MPEPVRAPIVLRPDPREGWEAAGPLHRGLAVGAFGCVIVAMVGWTAMLGILVLLAMLVAIPCFGAAARVLRPYPPGSPTLERRFRHGAAAVATACGSTFLLYLLPDPGSSYAGGGFWDDGGAPVVYGWMLASLLGPVTLAWGLISVLVRSISRVAQPQPARPAPTPVAVAAAGYGYGNPPPADGVEQPDGR